jgi:colicin import membrane protein
MHERAPNAFFFSLALHVGVVIAIVSLAFVVQHNQPPPVQIFELVAGPPTDLTATEAPALGSEDGKVEVKIHETPAKSEPVAAEPEPAVRPETKPVPKTPPKSDTKTLSKADSKTSGKSDAKISYKDFVAKHPKPAPSKQSGGGGGTGAKAPQLKTHGIPDGVVGGSSRSHGGGGGKALTAAQHSAMEAYTSRLVAALRQNHQKPLGLSDLLSADVECLIGADGTIANVHIDRSSGNAAFDQSCIEAFMRMGTIGPTPDGKSGTWNIKFHMVDPD